MIVGKVFIHYQGTSFAFKSSGFVYRFDNKNFFITTNHTLSVVEKEFGKNVSIYIQLPFIREDLFESEFLFNEPSEDSAVFVISDPAMDDSLNILYESPLSLQKNEKLTFVGYSGSIYDHKEPEKITSTFLSSASESYDLRIMRLPPNLNPEWRSIFLCSSNTFPEEGFSGGPVFKYDSDTLIGMVNGYGDDKLDDRIFSILGVKKYSIFVPLDKTIQKIKEIR